MSTLDSHTLQHGLHTGLQKYPAPNPGSPRHRGQSHANGQPMRHSRSQDGYSESRSRSPERMLGGVHTTRRNTSPLPSPTLNTPLLMPPPTTRLGDIKHYALIARYRAEQWQRRNAGTLGFALRLALFLSKVSSLSWVCWPYGFSSSVGAPLVVLASLDLAIPSSAGEGIGNRVVARRGSRAGGSPDTLTMHDTMRTAGTGAGASAECCSCSISSSCGSHPALRRSARRHATRDGWLGK